MTGASVAPRPARCAGSAPVPVPARRWQVRSAGARHPVDRRHRPRLAVSASRHCMTFGYVPAPHPWRPASGCIGMSVRHGLPQPAPLLGPAPRPRARRLRATQAPDAVGRRRRSPGFAPLGLMARACIVAVAELAAGMDHVGSRADAGGSTTSAIRRHRRDAARRLHVHRCLPRPLARSPRDQFAE